MSTGTVTSPLFEKSAEETAERLAQVDGPQAAAMAREAQDLVATFRSWAQQRPDDAERVATINRLFDLNRRAMDFLLKAGPPSSGTRMKVNDDEDDEADAMPRSFPGGSASAASFRR